LRPISDAETATTTAANWSSARVIWTHSPAENSGDSADHSSHGAKCRPSIKASRPQQTSPYGYKRRSTHHLPVLTRRFGVNNTQEMRFPAARARRRRRITPVGRRRAQNQQRSIRTDGLSCGRRAGWQWELGRGKSRRNKRGRRRAASCERTTHSEKPAQPELSHAPPNTRSTHAQLESAKGR
jgi:hypothetical protein